jgi:hypothetical protein
VSSGAAPSACVNPNAARKPIASGCQVPTCADPARCKRCQHNFQGTFAGKTANGRTLQSVLAVAEPDPMGQAREDVHFERSADSAESARVQHAVLHRDAGVARGVPEEGLRGLLVHLLVEAEGFALLGRGVGAQQVLERAAVRVLARGDHGICGCELRCELTGTRERERERAAEGVAAAHSP